MAVPPVSAVLTPGWAVPSDGGRTSKPKQIYFDLKFLFDGTTNTMLRLQTQPAGHWGKGRLCGDFKAVLASSGFALALL